MRRIEDEDFDLSQIRKWMYGRNCYFDFLARVEGEVTFVVKNPLASIPLPEDEVERLMTIEKFMPEVKYYDFLSEWEKHPTREFFSLDNVIFWQEDF